MSLVGIQLYTLRNKAESNLPAVLHRLAEIGYKGIELAGLYGHDPREVAAMVCDLGMQVTSSHTPLPTPETIGQMADTELALGNRRIITGAEPQYVKTVDDCLRFADSLNKAVELLSPHGMSMGFHNHWWEFEKIDGRRVYDIIMGEALDVFCELDIFWVAHGGADPVEYTAKYRNRLPLLHVKDGKVGTESPHLPAGSGDMPIPEIIDAADPNILEWLLVELDEYDGDMWEAVEKSYEYLAAD